MKAILKSTGIILDVLGVSGVIATDKGVIQEYRVKKETANYLSTFRIRADKIKFIK